MLWSGTPVGKKVGARCQSVVVGLPDELEEVVVVRRELVCDAVEFARRRRLLTDCTTTCA